MIVDGPYAVTLDTPLTLPDPAASSGGSSSQIQVQNQTGYTIEITLAQTYVIQSLQAMTIPLVGSGASVTILPTDEISSTQPDALIVVWLLPGEPAPMQDGPLSATTVGVSITGGSVNITGGEVSVDNISGTQLAVTQSAEVVLSDVLIPSSGILTVDMPSWARAMFVSATTPSGFSLPPSMTAIQHSVSHYESFSGQPNLQSRTSSGGTNYQMWLVPVGQFGDTQVQLTFSGAATNTSVTVAFDPDADTLARLLGVQPSWQTNGTHTASATVAASGNQLILPGPNDVIQYCLRLATAYPASGFVVLQGADTGINYAVLSAQAPSFNCDGQIVPIISEGSEGIEAYNYGSASTQVSLTYDLVLPLPLPFG